VKSHPKLDVTLRQLAELAEIRGAVHEVSVLRKAVAALEALGPGTDGHVIRLARSNRLSEIPGLPPEVHARIRDCVCSNADAIEAAHLELPQLVASLLDLGIVSTTEALVLTRDLGVATMADLEVALDDGRLERNMGSGVAQHLAEAIANLRVQTRRMPLGRALDIVEPLLAEIARSCPALADTVAAGDVRRFEPVADAIVLVARAVDPEAARDQIGALKGVIAVLHRTARRVILRHEKNEIDVRIATDADFGSVLLEATGSRGHLRLLNERSQGDPGARLSRVHEERVYSDLGLIFIPAELRQGRDEIEAAAAGRIPQLVAREHVRGDLHMHSTYSDGRDPLATMVETCHALGYEYIAITDHSERSAAARTLTPDQIVPQREEIDRLRERFPEMTILHGVEVDIMPDGRLDFSDAILERFDIVLASLHDAAGHDRARLTARCLSAIRHPLVNVIAHPANQMIGSQEGYDLDFGAIYAAAAETGTALEIDGGPGHLDLDGEHARAAIAAAVTVSIDSDCHRADRLDRQMRMGLGTARRGWVEPRHVLNSRPLSDLLAFIRSKRA
jgi:DNA polymerase (family 10)